MTSSLNPSVRSQSVTLTATVRANAPGSGTPTGKVTFKDGNRTLGNGTLSSSGQVSTTISNLSKGTHQITAVYAGSTHGNQRHMGNVWFKDRDHPEQLDLEAGANVTSLKDRFNVTRYLTPDSDLVALMILAHQTRLHNLISRVNWETRLALDQEASMSESLGVQAATWSGSTRDRIYSAVEKLLRSMLFTDEIPLEASGARRNARADVHREQKRHQARRHENDQLQFEWEYSDRSRVVTIGFTGKVDRNGISGIAKIGDVAEGTMTAQRR